MKRAVEVANIVQVDRFRCTIDFSKNIVPGLFWYMLILLNYTTKFKIVQRHKSFIQHPQNNIHAKYSKMPTNYNLVRSAIADYLQDTFIIQTVQGRLDEEMKVDGWISLILRNRECIILKFCNGIFMNEVYMLNDDKVLKAFCNDSFSDSYCCVKRLEDGIIDLDHGTRFEGKVLYGIPFGYGKMYDDDGILVYKGIMINWKRFGYGTSYHNNGCIGRILV